MVGESQWTPDLPDFRDHSIFDEEYSEVHSVPHTSKIDLSEYCLAPEMAGKTPSSAAVSVGGLVEFHNRRLGRETGYVSKVFIDAVGKRIANSMGQDVSIRTALKVIARFGVPPSHCAASEHILSDPLSFSFREEYSRIRFARVDSNHKPRKILKVIKKLLTSNRPCVFGFPTMDSMAGLDAAMIELRPAYDVPRGCTTALIVGYDDSFRMTSKGAFLIRGTWGKEWARNGFGWLDYKFLEYKLMRDIWTVVVPDADE